MLPQVSVITATKDDGARLGVTLDSLSAQRGVSLEHIVVDGSTLEVPVLPKSGGRLRRQVLTKVGGGPYAAMNAGASIAQGRLLCFLNAGDALASPSSLHDLVELSSTACWGYGAVGIAEPSGRVRLYSFSPFRRWMLTLGLRYVPHPSSFVERGIFEELGGFDCSYPVAADQEFFLRVSRISQPAVSSALVATFQLGGASTRSVREAAIDFQLLRRQVDGPLLDSRLVDRLATEAVCAGRSIVRATRALDPRQ